MKLIGTSQILGVAVLLAGAAAACHAQAPTIATVDPSIQYQKWEGWGTSLAWWAKVVGGFPEATRRDYVEKAFDPQKGLGLNVVRYNIGGGENPARPAGPAPGFREAVPGYESSPGKWDWDADANQRWVLREAIRMGANQLEAFSNSPPWWMTVSGSVTGNRGGADNLKPEDNGAFADYLTTVVKHFHDAWRITFRDLEPLNEPTGGWRFGNHQEGCHVDRAHQDAVVKTTGAALARQHVDHITVTASDEPSINAADQTFPYYDPAALRYLSKINTHSYGGGDRTQLFDFANAAGKDLWLSEYGDGDASGLRMAREIVTDVKNLHPSAWVYWQVVDSAGGWGFLRNPLQNETDTSYTINEKYYVMAQFSRFIRPGYRFIAIDNPDSLAAYNAERRTLVIVTTNDKDADAHIVYDLSRFDHPDGAVTAYRTSPSEKLERLPNLELSKGRIAATLPARSVTSYIIRNAVYRGARGIDFRDYFRLAPPNRDLALGLPAEAQPPAGVVVRKIETGDAALEWGLIGVGDGCYKVVNRSSGLVLDVSQASMTAGAEIIQYHDNGGDNQLWRLTPEGDNTFSLVNRHSGLMLGASGTSTGSAVVQQRASGGASTRWRLIRASGG